MSHSNQELANLQAILLDLLYRFETSEEIMSELRALKLSPNYEAWIDQFQPSMLETGAELVKKWGAKSASR